MLKIIKRPGHYIFFFDGISKEPRDKIYTKNHSYKQHGDVCHGKHLKVLNSRIWKYKGTIYKLRVDNANESARVLFSKSIDGDLIVIHGFLKTTQKTPAKGARQANEIYQALEKYKTVIWNSSQYAAK